MSNRTIISAAVAGVLLASTAYSAAPDPRPYSVDTPIGILVKDPAAKALVDRYLPGMSGAASTVAIRGASPRATQSFMGLALSEERLATLGAELAKLTPKPWSPSDVGWVINANESLVGRYTLPDPLKLSNGAPVRNAATWWNKRRPEIVNMFETIEYGRAPARPAEQSFEVVDKGSPAFDGKAIRKQVIIHLSKDPAAPTIHLVQYVPAAAKAPVPMYLSLGFSAPSQMFADPGIRKGMVWDPQSRKKVPAQAPSPNGAFDPRPYLDAGIGVASFYYGDIEPDFPEGYANGIRGFYAKGQPQPASGWGAIGAWAWAASRAMDYFETDASVDAKRVAIAGGSRLGKTAMWAGAHDQRFAAVVALCSGEGGAALSRRNFGQTIGELNDEAPHQFAPRYRTYGGKEASLPMDSHMLIALVAPRPLLLQTGNVDHWSDPKGEFLAAVAAGPVYRLLGKQGLGTASWPPSPTVGKDIEYALDVGGHMTPMNKNYALAFVKKHLTAR
jgi:hypothetical protein